MAVTADVRLVNCGEGSSRFGLERSSIEAGVLGSHQLPVIGPGGFRAGFRAPDSCQGLRHEPRLMIECMQHSSLGPHDEE